MLVRSDLGLGYWSLALVPQIKGLPVCKGLFQPSHENPVVSSNELRVWALALEGAKSECTVDVTVHLGLKRLAEKQLFHDLNNLTKKSREVACERF